jgi:phytoene synthase
MILDLDPDRRLALAYVPARQRPALEALWRLDVTFASVLATGRDRMVGRIRLAWWREALEKLDREAAPAEPLLQALAAHALPAGVAGAELAAMEEGWALLLADLPLGAGELEAFAALRGGLLFRYSARLLGIAEFPVEPAGRRWALADLARHSSNAEEAQSAIAAAVGEEPARWPRALRPLGMLAALARRDVARGAGGREKPGSPARMLRMLRHRLTGY